MSIEAEAANLFHLQVFVVQCPRAALVEKPMGGKMHKSPRLGQVAQDLVVIDLTIQQHLASHICAVTLAAIRQRPQIDMANPECLHC